MDLTDWVPVAQVASSIIAAIGLLLTACALGFTAFQMSRTRRTADLQALQKFSEDANKREAALTEAKAKGRDEWRHAFFEFLNCLELYACAYNTGLFLGRGSKNIIRAKLLDGVVEIEAEKEAHQHFIEAVDRTTTFDELGKLKNKHPKEVSRLREEKKNKKRLAAASATPGSTRTALI